MVEDLIITLTAVEPLVITSGSAESMAHECLGYVPGNMLLGAMAAAWKRLNPGVCPDDSPSFRRLFLNGEVSWGHAMPLCCGAAAVPVPLSYMRVKNHKPLPFESGGTANEDYCVFNMLALKESQQPQEMWREKHPESEEVIKLKKMRPGFMNPQNLHLACERRVWNVHVALGDSRSALKSQLYGYSAVARGTLLQARVICKTAEARKELAALAEQVKSFCAGHARSAGYGRVRAEISWQAQPSTQRPAKKTFDLFLVSQYLPSSSWQNPLHNLCREIERLVSQKPTILKSYVGQLEIQGYNGFWNKPRAARTALAQGSALRIEFDSPVALPEQFCLGGGQTEGYGRIICDPPFLAAAMPRPVAAVCSQSQTQASAPVMAQGSVGLWSILRERAATRLMEEQTSQWLHESGWQKFLEDAARLTRPTDNQRNSLRSMKLDAFRSMLGKTPGEQWKQAVAYCPFTARKDHLSAIMLKLLDLGVFGKKWNLAALALPGGAASRMELEKLAPIAHNLFIRQLVSTWGKMSRLAEKE